MDCAERNGRLELLLGIARVLETECQATDDDEDRYQLVMLLSSVLDCYDAVSA